MGNIRIDPKKQFSKRLARWTAIFWFIYMIYLITVMLLQPNTGIYTVYMGIIVSVVMIVNVLAYTHNSVIEKLAFYALDRVGLELNMNNKKEGTDADGSEVSNG